MKLNFHQKYKPLCLIESDCETVAQQEKFNTLFFKTIQAVKCRTVTLAKAYFLIQQAHIGSLLIILQYLFDRHNKPLNQPQILRNNLGITL